jgi:hypothetical protein
MITGVMRWNLPAAAVLAVGLLAALELPGVSPAAETPAVDGALHRLRISSEEGRRLARGEIVSYPVTEHSERELAVGLAVFVAAPLSHLDEYLASGQLIAQDVTISDFGIVSDPASPNALSGVRFTTAERGEAESLLEASPGTRMNLSLSEIEILRGLRTSADRPSKTPPAETALDAYRRLLHQRLLAYQQGGLAAIVPYARSGGAVTDPAAELRHAVSDAEGLGREGPGLREALLRYPSSQPPELVSRLYWIKRRVQRRPDLCLLHQMLALGPSSAIHVERYFYVGHSYNASQIITGAFEFQDGTVLFATSRVSTDEVLGVGNQMKRSIGRAQLKDEMRRRLDRVRAVLSRSQPVQSP